MEEESQLWSEKHRRREGRVKCIHLIALPCSFKDTSLVATQEHAPGNKTGQGTPMFTARDTQWIRFSSYCLVAQNKLLGAVSPISCLISRLLFFFISRGCRYMHSHKVQLCIATKSSFFFFLKISPTLHTRFLILSMNSKQRSPCFLLTNSEQSKPFHDSFQRTSGTQPLLCRTVQGITTEGLNTEAENQG